MPLIHYSRNIKLLESGEKWQKEVIKYLDLVKTTSAGQTLTHYIDMLPRENPLLIHAWTRESNELPNAEAYTYRPEDGTKEGVPVIDLEEVAPGVPAPIYKGPGTGAGALVRLAYHPAAFAEQTKRRGGYMEPGTGPGEVLFHEMVHAYRWMAGMGRSNTPVVGYPLFTDLDEFYAILAANVYRSERGFTRLRADHKTSNWTTSTSSDYYDEFKSQIQTWFADQLAFCLAMARCPAKFNPFRSCAIDMQLMPASSVPMSLKE
jgi:hypothetical protein